MSRRGSPRRDPELGFGSVAVSIKVHLIQLYEALAPILNPAVVVDKNLPEIVPKAGKHTIIYCLFMQII